MKINTFYPALEVVFDLKPDGTTVGSGGVCLEAMASRGSRHNQNKSLIQTWVMIETRCMTTT